MEAPGFLESVEHHARTLRRRMEETAAAHPKVIENVRGLGLMLGVKCVVPAGDMVAALRDRHVLVVPAGDNVVRFLPPLIIDEGHIEAAVSALDDAAKALTP
jgi:acetylornithine/N-succinyldiaminopimelate aminotransferase